MRHEAPDSPHAHHISCESPEISSLKERVSLRGFAILHASQKTPICHVQVFQPDPHILPVLLGLKFTAVEPRAWHPSADDGIKRMLRDPGAKHRPKPKHLVCLHLRQLTGVGYDRLVTMSISGFKAHRPPYLTKEP